MSSAAQHLISWLCTYSMSKRLTAREALDHPWITRQLHLEMPLTAYERQELRSKEYLIEERLRKVTHSSSLGYFQRVHALHSLLVKPRK